jgi:hypothetical protein
VTAVATYTTPYGAHPYLTTDEYRAAPTSVDTTNLVPGGIEGDQDVALANLILRASSWADTFCDQVLAATLNIETARVRADRMGMLHIHPKNWPILEVRDVQWGPWPNQLTSAVDFSSLWIEEQEFHIPMGSSSLMTSLGPLQFSGNVPSGQPLFVRYSYVNSWPDTITTSAPGSAGATALTVANATGIYGGIAATATQTVPSGSSLGIFDGQYSESIQVASIAGNVLTLQSPTTQPHTSNVVVTALPAAVKQAIVLLTSSLVKTRGTEAIVMGQANMIGSLQSVDPVGRADLMQAWDLLRPYRRIR